MCALRETIGSFIKKLRVETHVSQGHLAEKMGISQASLSRIESGNQEVTFTTVLEIAAIIRCDIHCAFNENDNFTIAANIKGRDENLPFYVTYFGVNFDPSKLDIVSGGSK